MQYIHPFNQFVTKTTTAAIAAVALSAMAPEHKPTPAREVIVEKLKGIKTVSVVVVAAVFHPTVPCYALLTPSIQKRISVSLSVGKPAAVSWARK